LRARRQKRASNHDRWLVSYADFITLIFAFFVVLYSTSQADIRKQNRVASSIDQAFNILGIFTGKGKGANNIAVLPPEPNTNAEIATANTVHQNLDHLRSEMEILLAKQISESTVKINLDKEGLVISLREAGFYESGAATPEAASLPVLEHIAQSLAAEPYEIRIEGHTDNIPIHNSQYQSNWELSSARASYLARYFVDRRDLPPYQLSTGGYAEFHPVADNNSSEGRAQNRRVDIVVLPHLPPHTNPSVEAPH